MNEGVLLIALCCELMNDDALSMNGSALLMNTYAVLMNAGLFSINRRGL